MKGERVAKPKPPILPRRPSDPTGTDALERRAMREFNRRLRSVRRAYVDVLDRIPRERVLTPNAVYEYRLDSSMLRSILEDASRLVDQIMLEGGQENLWFFDAYVSTAYRRGTAQALANMGQQSAEYRRAKGPLRDVLTSEPYRHRLALIAAREFEEMRGFSGEMKADMARILTDGLGRGQNPREIARRLSTQIGTEEKRAARIARTEIPTALRRARLDEAQDAEESYNLRLKEMHFSALSPTTRITHAQRHGKIYTAEEQRDWWSRDANAINCKCSTITVLVDENGDPLDPSVVKRARDAEIKVRRERKGPWSD